MTFFTPVRPKRQKNRIFSVLQLGVALAMPYIPHAERHSTHHLDDHGEMYGEGAESSSKEEGRSEGSEDGRQGSRAEADQGSTEQVGPGCPHR
ncbi:hypothetical protein [Dyella sp. EPa41]|uniref:hypothetical protein n=1 Tax=Dyella sp. EPa41 TaxID=1561194 RepID=UPI001F1CB9B6|nr:hypothetical protein [Dyella sp. EPa41]